MNNDDYCYFEDEDMPKPRAKKEEPVELVESLFGTKFPAMPKDMWYTYKGLDKPVYLTELSLFERHYGECSIKKIYLDRRKLYRTSDNRLISKEFTEGKKPLWSLCAFTNYACLTENMIECFGHDDDGEETKYLIGPEIAKTHTFICDFDHKRYKRSGYKVDVYGSEKYKCIAAQHSDDGVNFKKCDGCGMTWEFKMVKYIEGGGPFGGGAHYCSPCSRKFRNNGVIRKHDHKGYPNHIYTYRENLGHEIKDGIVYSTGKVCLNQEVRLYGVEVETELFLDGAIKAKVDRFDLARELMSCLGKDFIIIKEDGTLTINGKYSDKEHPYGPMYAGFEVVSAAAPLEIHRQRWSKLSEFKYIKLLRAWDEPYCRTCGFHIHLSREAIESDLTGGRMLAFLNADANRKFIWKVAGRSEVAFTKYMKHKVTDFIHPERVINPDEKVDHRNRSRRVALNLSNEATVEMRIFRGTVHPDHIIRNIEFYDSLLEFCSPCTRSFNEIYDFKYYVKFVDQNRKRWPLLASWFAKHDIISLKKIKRPEKADFSKLTIKTQDVPESELINV